MGLAPSYVLGRSQHEGEAIERGRGWANVITLTPTIQVDISMYAVFG